MLKPDEDAMQTGIEKATTHRKRTLRRKNLRRKQNEKEISKNKNVEIYTIDRLCSILHCKIEDIVEHVHEPDERNEHTEKASEKNNPYSEDKKNSL